MPGLDSEEISNILFLLKRQYYQSAIGRCDHLLKLHHASSSAAAVPPGTIPPADPETGMHYGFWRGAGLILLGKYNEAIRELVLLAEKPSLGLAVTTALLYAHKKCASRDADAIANLEAYLAVAEQTTTVADVTYFSLVTFLAATGDLAEAHRWLNVAFARYPGDTSPWIEMAAGWVYLMSPPAAGDARSVSGNGIGSDTTTPGGSRGRVGGGSNDSMDSTGSGPAAYLAQNPAATAVSTDTPFDALLSRFPKDVGVLTGRLLGLIHAGRAADATNAVVAQLLGVRPRHTAALLAGLLDGALAAGDWDRVGEACHRILGVERPSTAATTVTTRTNAGGGAGGTGGGVPTMEAFLLQFLTAVLRDGDTSRAAQSAASLTAALRREEGDNPTIAARVLHMLGRLPASATALLPPAVTRDWLAVAERMSAAVPNDPDTLCVHARLAVRMGHWARARQLYAQATSADASHVRALEGTAGVELAVLDGRAPGDAGGDEAARWTALSRDVQLLATVAAGSPATEYLQAELAWRTARDAGLRTAHLRAAVDATVAGLATAIGLEYLERADLGLLSDIAAAALELCPARPRVPAPPAVAVLCMAAECVAQLYPVSPDAAATAAWAAYLDGDAERARETAKAAVEASPGHWPATQVLVRLRLASAGVDGMGGATTGGKASSPWAAAAALVGISASAEAAPVGDVMSLLDSALALNLELRRSDAFHVLRARVLRATGEPVPLAVAELDQVAAPDRLAPLDALTYWTERVRTTPAADLPGVLATARRALALFPPLLSDLHVCEAQVRAASDPSAALSLLRDVASADPGLASACVRAMGPILVDAQRDARGYVRECSALVESHPGSKDAHVQLAAAFLAAGDVDRAVDTLMSALCYFPDAADLARAVANVLLANHEYARALEYLQDAVSQAPPAGRAVHAVALAKLHFKLGQSKRAVEVLEALLCGDEGEPAVAWPAADAEADAWELLGDARKSCDSPNLESVADAWRRARDKSRTPSRRAALCVKLAGVAEVPAAVETLLEQARQLDPASTAAAVALAEQYLRQGKADAARAIAGELAAGFPREEKVASLMAAVLIHQRKFDEALEYMKRVLDGAGAAGVEAGKKEEGGDLMSGLIAGLTGNKAEPTKPAAAPAPAGPVKRNYEVLVQAIDLMHRLGRLDEAKVYLDVDAATGTAHAVGSAGRWYSLGQYHQYRGEIRESVRAYKRCRADARWRVRATERILDLLLFPDLHALDRSVDGAVLGVADRLIRSLPAGPDRCLWEAYAKFGSRKKADIESALAGLQRGRGGRNGIASDDVAGLLACAIAHLLLQADGKAKAALKLIASREWDLAQAAWLEAGWLLLAQQYLVAGKADAADALVRSCMEVNPHGGGARAHTLYATVAERAGDAEGACRHWHAAWTAAGKSDPHVAARLALAYLRAERPTSAVPAALRALELLGKQAGMEGSGAAFDPVVHVPSAAVPGSRPEASVPVRLRSDVLDKARAALRP
ncbi:hypothetical protein H9P43_005204 [Blastocladiella emersonii ATCC 22665]|nr:hypothetical protein H9P43_005204 [Blastocladiella emersonii ATCC 22665]